MYILCVLVNVYLTASLNVYRNLNAQLKECGFVHVFVLECNIDAIPFVTIRLVQYRHAGELVHF